MEKYIPNGYNYIYKLSSLECSILKLIAYVTKSEVI